MGTMGSQINNLTIVYSTVYSSADQNKHQSSASLAFVQGIHRWPVNSPLKGQVMQIMFPFDDIIMRFDCLRYINKYYMMMSWHENLSCNTSPMCVTVMLSFELMPCHSNKNIPCYIIQGWF